MQGNFYVIKNLTQLEGLFNVLRESCFKKPKAVQIKDYKPPKTTPQVAYAHSLINYIALDREVDEKEVKTEAKRNWGVIIVSTSCITGERTAKLKSFADYSKEEMETFLYQAQAFCDQEGIYYIPSNK